MSLYKLANNLIISRQIDNRRLIIPFQSRRVKADDLLKAESEEQTRIRKSIGMIFPEEGVIC